jgi:hypothetical protein
MHMRAAQGEDVQARVGKLRSGFAMSGDEHVAAAVVMENPSDVPRQEVIEVVVSFMREAPDAFTRVVEVAGAALSGAAVTVDLDTGRCRLDGGVDMRPGRVARARERHEHAKEYRDLDARHHVVQYGARVVRGQTNAKRSAA